MGGPEMLLKAMGINPSELQAKLQQFLDGVKLKLNELDKRLTHIEEMLKEIHDGTK